MSAQRAKSKATSTSATQALEDRGTVSLGQAGERVKSYAWMQFGEIVVDGRVFKHGDPVELSPEDPATEYLTCLDFDIRSPDAD